MTSRYSFADLFAGCGGLSLGLSEAGLIGQFAVERDPMAFETFATNFLDGQDSRYPFSWPGWLAKRAWDIDELLSRHSADLRELRGQIDILAGGPPCQGYSFAGRRLEDDPRNLLFERYVQIVDLLQPQALVLENVPGMRVAHSRRNVVQLWAGDQKEPAHQASFYDRLKERLLDVGYRTEAMLIDASRFGVPQRRSRLIAVGVREDLYEWLDGGLTRPFELIEDARLEQLAELGLGAAISAQAAISDLEISGRTLVDCADVQSGPGFKELDYEGPRTEYQRRMHAGMPGSMNSMRLARHRQDVQSRFARILSECRQGVRMDESSRQSYGLKKHRIFPMAPGEPAPTITTLPDDVLHYAEPRILTVRESARLQSFPDWFVFKGKFTTGGDRRTKECPRYTQVGNAVPPLLARAIGSALHMLLEEVVVTKRVFGSPAAIAAAACGSR